MSPPGRESGSGHFYTFSTSLGMLVFQSLLQCGSHSCSSLEGRYRYAPYVRGSERVEFDSSMNIRLDEGT